MSLFKTVPRLVRKGCLMRDIKSIVRYGYKEAPKTFEKIWINPLLVNDSLANVWPREHSALVVDGDWDLKNRIPCENVSKIKMCRAHFIQGLSWEESGIFDHAKRKIKRNGNYDGCVNMGDVVRRYQNLDELYFALKAGQRFLPQADLFNGNLREFGGIVIHIGRNRELIFGGGGHHRFAIAQILKLDKIPAQLGVIHQCAMGQNLMYELRQV